MSKKLLIVESPTKEKTIAHYLGADFVVKSSVGHIRDLPKKSEAIQITKVGENQWKFDPVYVVPEEKKKVVAGLKSAAKDVDAIYLASDPDREGEAIAWHLQEILKKVAPEKPFYRVTYNEITKKAVQNAVEHPGEVNLALVDAQQARRILDRIVGYKVSPLLWSNISCPNSKTLSAGRVQSVALRLLVERQRAIEAFVPEPYYVLGVEAEKAAHPSFVARLARIDDKKPEITGRQMADNTLLDLSGSQLVVTDVKAQKRRRRPVPPFMTSSMQQAASSFLAMSPGRTMKIAQQLFEMGLITYMRTDSFNISDDARQAAKDFIVNAFGANYYPEKPNFYNNPKSQVKDGGAHEAIRPTDVRKTPQNCGLAGAELKLYEMIWRRFVASQMIEAQTTVRTAVLEPRKMAIAHTYSFSASTTDIDFDGFLRVLKLPTQKPTSDTGETEEEDDNVAALPPLTVGEELKVIRWISDEKLTKGPSHYTEASLVKALEDNGVGRPSTYATTVETLKLRKYAVSEKRKLIPTPNRGILVSDWLTKKLDPLFNVGFTAQMEANLDRIEANEESMNEMLSEFYATFLKELETTATPPPEQRQIELVLALLGEVTTWKPPLTIKNRVYDDHAYVDKVRAYYDKHKTITAKHLDILVRLAMVYKEQIHDIDQRLADVGLSSAVPPSAPKADMDVVAYCFEVLDRIGGMMSNPFLKSLRDQFDQGRMLTMKQLAVLARTVGDNATHLPDVEEIRQKLVKYVPEGFKNNVVDPAVVEMLSLLDHVQTWRPVIQKGRKKYDDHDFIESLKEQYDRRHSLSARQMMALKRVIAAYQDQIPDYEKYQKLYDLSTPTENPKAPRRSRGGRKKRDEM